MSELPALTPVGASGLQLSKGPGGSSEEVPAAASKPRHSLGVFHASYSVR